MKNDVTRDAVAILKAQIKNLKKEPCSVTKEDIRYLAALCNGYLHLFGETRIVTFEFNQKFEHIAVHAIMDGKQQMIIFDHQNIIELT